MPMPMHTIIYKYK